MVTTTETRSECNHKYKTVEEEKDKHGRILVMCEICGTSRYITNPNLNEGKSDKPLLME